MANKEVIVHQQQFVEEIDYNEIETEQVVGKGSFGVVWKGKWKGRYVAVKHINSEGERKAFAVEVRQLSRVSHPNIVKLYGACTKNPVCLVMEYAEGGSLYNVLHCNPQPHYTAGHAMSWALQCARGVAYLHNMKPKPLIHRVLKSNYVKFGPDQLEWVRMGVGNFGKDILEFTIQHEAQNVCFKVFDVDLKPPNLLLVMGGQMLKICDFGTACDLNTYMTNNKGSAAWMAPEVFEGSRYTEKCDVFSWGVILWEVLSRKKPFDEIGGSAYRIMWAVHIGQRPPLIEGCPKPIEDLMTKCWQKAPEERPSMDEVVRIMTALSEFFSGHLDPVEYSLSSEIAGEDDSKNDTYDMASPLNSQINGSVTNGTIHTIKTSSNSNVESIGTIFEKKSSLNSSELLSRSGELCSMLEIHSPVNARVVASSNVNSIGISSSGKKATSRDKRSTSLLPSNTTFTPLHVECDPNTWQFGSSTESSWEICNMAGLDKMVQKTRKNGQGRGTTSEDLDNVYRLLDAELRPVTPDNTCERSREIFEEHKQLAQEYLKVQTEIALLGQHNNEMLKNLSIDSLTQQQELRELEDEKESLVKLYRNLKRQLEIMKGQRSNNTFINSTVPSIGTTISANNGWVVIPRHDPSRLS